MDANIHLAQIEPTLGNLEANLELHLAAVDAARAAGADICLFPELSLSGYFLKDQTAEVSFAPDAAPLASLRERSEEVSIGVGFVERGRDGRRFNAYAFLEGGKTLHIHRKVHLATYGMFEESRDLGPGEHFRLIESRYGRLGVLICEDAWHLTGGWLYFLAGADALVVPSCSPARDVSRAGEGLGSSRKWSKLLSAQALLFQSWVLYVNRVGCEDGVTFAGESRAIDPFGEEVGRLSGLGAGHLPVALDAHATERARLKTPLRRDEKAWIVRRELERLEGAAP
ncbi:MAG: nitrilase-related carbon-nitrogen hydrolase [Planctomycetota bacterium]|jgi:predicted amidohydrolase|nr:nitrilase-related carbon-nitrogen hydrolase [Planctomycetota bacterium]MDP6762742.1 nitrilase-related carbon-nitrogen hydrolase [Planctomycetota bacterium]MDP6988532.1 nitrilase-related carbon-nitrogen hydrolase [Planctomycetota bacterium]